MLCTNPISKTLFLRLCLVVTSALALATSVKASSPPDSTIAGVAAVFHDTCKTDGAESVTALPVVAVPFISPNKHVADYVTAYLKKEDEFLQKMKGRSSSLFRTINNVFEQQGVPSQLKYLAIVESELRNAATSRVGAKGLWQLMPVTARELGLRVRGKTDERTHTYRSTVAAAKYLHSLYAEFGDWLLVLAAYNSGPGTVMKAMKKSGSKNFWTLQRFLPAESRGHVKRFISIHYFFEGEGSIATQTAAEAKAHAAKLLTQQKELLQDVVCAGQ